MLWRGTDGFRALTSEQARRRAIAAAPRSVPVVELEDQDGRSFTLDVYRGRPVVVDFVYTQCTSICPLLSDGFKHIDAAERSRRDDARRLQLVSITFDPRDTPVRLREYAARYDGDGQTWRFARVRHPGDLGRLLQAFGIVVIPDATGGFQHNAAVHVVDAQGRLARVLDVEAQPAEVARAVAAVSQ
jgi:protein SCO1/2